MKCFNCKIELTDEHLQEGYSSVYKCPQCGVKNC